MYTLRIDEEGKRARSRKGFASLAEAKAAAKKMLNGSFEAAELTVTEVESERFLVKKRGESNWPRGRMTTKNKMHHVRLNPKTAEWLKKQSCTAGEAIDRLVAAHG